MKRPICFHRNEHSANCDLSGSTLVKIFGVVQVVLSQFPSLENITWLSVAAAAVSFAYSVIGLGLCIGHIEVASTGKQNDEEGCNERNWTQDIGYVAFGNVAPGNILTGFGSYDPFWLVDIVNMCLIVHLVGACQVYAQPIFVGFENRIASRWPKFVHKAYTIRVPLRESGTLSFTISKIILHSLFVIVTTVVVMSLSFFNAILGLLGAFSFWPLTVYFSVAIHIAQAGINKGTLKWTLLQSLSTFCLLISLVVSVASIVDIGESLKIFDYVRHGIDHSEETQGLENNSDELAQDSWLMDKFL